MCKKCAHSRYSRLLSRIIKRLRGDFFRAVAITQQTPRNSQKRRRGGGGGGGGVRYQGLMAGVFDSSGARVIAELLRKFFGAALKF